MLDEFSKNFDAEMQNHSLPTGFPKARRRRKASLSDSEIMTILLVFHFGTFANFKHYYLLLSGKTQKDKIILLEALYNRPSGVHFQKASPP